MKLHLAIITSDGGQDVMQAPTYEALMANIHADVVDWWPDLYGDKPIPDDPNTAVSEYFEGSHGGLTLNTHVIEVDGPDATIDNLYPDCDAIHVDIGHWSVAIGRDANEDVHVIVGDKLEGSTTFLTAT